MRQAIDIRPHDLAIVQSILQQVLPKGARVWVFGSRATWTVKAGSDLDLAIEADRPLTYEELGNLADMFDESDLAYRVDIVDMKTVSANFKKIVEQSRVELNWQA